MPGFDPPCGIDVHDVFGPIVATSCQEGKDFTLLFEESILTLVPLAIAICWASIRVSILWRSSVKARRSWLFWSKTSAYAVNIALQAATLALWIQPQFAKTRLTIPTLSLQIAGYALFLPTSCLEHEYSLRPSSAINAFLGISTLFEIAHLRTVFFVFGSHQLLAWFVLSCFLARVGVFVLELVEKRALLLPEWKNVAKEETSGLYSRLLLLWLNPLFVSGYRGLLKADSLPALDSRIVAASNPLALTEKWHAEQQPDKRSLLRILLLHYKWDLLAGVIPRVAYTGFVFTEPLLLERVLDFAAGTEEPRTNLEAYDLIAAYAVVYIGKATTHAYYQHKTYRLVTMLRGSLVSLIYNKTTRINSAEISDAEAVTLMSADIDRIALSLEMLYDLSVGVLEIGLSIWLLYRLLGVAMIAPCVYVVVCLIIGIPFATAAGNAQEPWLEAIEERLAATTQMLGASTAVRFSGLSGVFSNIIGNLRAKEIRVSRRYRLLGAVETVISYASSLVAPLWAFTVYILMSKANGTPTLTEGVAFASLSLFDLLDMPLVYMLSGAEDIQTLINSIGRIQKYLLLREKEACLDRKEHSGDLVSLIDDATTPSPLTTSTSNTEVDDITQNGPIVVLENVFAGYSKEETVLQDLNLQIQSQKTTMVVGPVASGKSTFLKLLLGEMPEVLGLLWKTFSTCAYCPQSPWISWGTIRSNIVGASPWDAAWYKTVVEACALVADFNELPDGDQTKTGTRGSRLSGGQKIRVALARALFSRKPIMILDDVLTGLDRTTERALLDAVFGPSGLVKQLNATVVLSTNSVSHAQFADFVIVLNEDGKVAEQGSIQSLSASGGYVQRLMGKPAPMTLRKQLELSEDTLQELDLPDDKEEIDTTSRRRGDFTVYKYFVDVSGRWTILSYVLTCAAYVFGITFPSVWLQWWTNANALYPNQDVGYWLGIYSLTIVIAIGSCCTSDIVFQLTVVPKIAWRFHEILLTTTMTATTTFLASTDSGQITNRFSQDLQLIDNDLPDYFDSMLVSCFYVLMAGVLVFTGSGYLSAAIPFCIVAVYVIQSYYLKTSRQLRLLGIETKAPLFSHFLETLEGVASIRAYGWTDNYKTRNREILNTSQSPYYLLWCIRQWIGLVLDLLTGGIAVLLIALATSVRHGHTSLLGVAVFNLIHFSSALQRMISQWVHVETAIGAINRIRTYSMMTEKEDQAGEDSAPPPQWPSAGAVVFSNVSASYGNAAEPVLKNIDLSFRPGEKVAICGRTGSGKSSLVSSLLRMVDIDSGQITIDGIDITKMKRQGVREGLNALPQEPFLLHGNVRDNIDPLGLAAEEDITTALQDVKLAAAVEAQGGLDSDVGELSRGQQQLLCLARALVRPGKLVLLDEATSSIDFDNEEFIRQLVLEKFGDCTILTIVHKLHTIFDFDRVVLLENGRVVESGKPRELLGSNKSAFYALYHSATEEGE